MQIEFLMLKAMLLLLSGGRQHETVASCQGFPPALKAAKALEEVLDMRPLSRAVFLLKATAAWPSASKVQPTWVQNLATCYLVSNRKTKDSYADAVTWVKVARAK